MEVKNNALNIFSRTQTINHFNVFLLKQNEASFLYKNRVSTGQEMVREEKLIHGQGKVREFYFESGKIDILKKSHGKLIEIT